ncbi:hypothetical protein RvY_16527 [Ramazzottius varieornatus]|uniref:tRNA N(3)-methylcytidine methyltransferase n=1 Tax=Ramazzottius varieornatus TaxID=947166 RepID=A0A1D1VZL0_RAMVA|nr:hypothetical protein RvY_16527 [Ramazzottius varieornatus]
MKVWNVLLFLLPRPSLSSRQKRYFKFVRRKMDDEQTLNRIARVRNRTLDDCAKVFEKNAWDDIEWTEEKRQAAESRVLLNSSNPLSEEEAGEYVTNAGKHWNNFYEKHSDQFFKKRQWLDSEFPEIMDEEARLLLSPQSEELSVVFETGCGTGSTVIPLLRDTKRTFVHCCDFSENAIKLLKSSPEYDTSRCNAFVADLTDEHSEWPVPPESVDFIIIVYTLSAISPDKMVFVIQRLVRALKPGGRLFFRDYGKYDLAQLRFKPAQCAGENLYVRQDGTLAYFFTQEEVRNLFCSAGLKEEQNAVDRRLLVNRKKKLLMHRVWIQCKYSKPEN